MERDVKPKSPYRSPVAPSLFFTENPAFVEGQPVPEDIV